MFGKQIELPEHREEATERIPRKSSSSSPPHSGARDANAAAHAPAIELCLCPPAWYLDVIFANQFHTDN